MGDQAPCDSSPGAAGLGGAARHLGRPPRQEGLYPLQQILA